MFPTPSQAHTGLAFIEHLLGPVLPKGFRGPTKPRSTHPGVGEISSGTLQRLFIFVAVGLPILVDIRKYLQHIQLGVSWVVLLGSRLHFLKDVHPELIERNRPRDLQRRRGEEKGRMAEAACRQPSSGNPEAPQARGTWSPRGCVSSPAFWLSPELEPRVPEPPSFSGLGTRVPFRRRGRSFLHASARWCSFTLLWSLGLERHQGRGLRDTPSFDVGEWAGPRKSEGQQAACVEAGSPGSGSGGG